MSPARRKKGINGDVNLGKEGKFLREIYWREFLSEIFNGNFHLKILLGIFFDKINTEMVENMLKNGIAESRGLRVFHDSGTNTMYYTCCKYVALKVSVLCL